MTELGKTYLSKAGFVVKAAEYDKILFGLVVNKEVVRKDVVNHSDLELIMKKAEEGFVNSDELRLHPDLNYFFYKWSDDNGDHYCSTHKADGEWSGEYEMIALKSINEFPSFVKDFIDGLEIFKPAENLEVETPNKELSGPLLKLQKEMLDGLEELKKKMRGD
ncbi:hypothetical protein GF352_00480 [archaeon]|nr:hypothetical protein [archaeon]